MIKLDSSNRDPIYTQLEKQIVKLITLGVYEKDSILPSVRSVACDLGINPNTVAKAYKNLEQMGIIYTVAGKGAFVSGENMSKLHSLTTSQLSSTLKDAKNAGVEKKTVIELVEQIWKEENK